MSNLPLILANPYLLVQVEILVQYFQMTTSSFPSEAPVLFYNDRSFRAREWIGTPKERV